MLEIVQGPFILRSMFRPETLADVDLDALADRMLTVLQVADLVDVLYRNVGCSAVVGVA